MKRIFLLFFLSLATVLCAKETVKIGLILPMTGNNAFIAEDITAAVRLVENELKTRATAFDYKFIVEDDSLILRRTVEAAHKLVETDKVDMLIPVFSQGGNVLKPYMQKQKGMMVGLFVSDTSVADGNLCFTCAADPVSEGKVYAKALQDLGYHRLAILGVKQQGAQLAHDGVVSALGTGVSMVADENFIFGERDFRTLWIKIREKNPDVVMINAFEPEFGIAMRHKAQMGVDAPLATIEWLSSCKLTPEFEGAWEVGPGPCLYTNGFAEKIKEFDPKVNDAVIAAYAYDMLNVIVSAYETAAKPGAGKPSRQAVAAELHNHEFEGELGTIHVDSRGVMDFPAGFWIVEGGQRVPVSFDELKAKLGR